MSRTAAETIKCFEEEPIFLGNGFRIPRRGANDSNFFWRENAVTEGILTVALTKRNAFLYREAD